MIVRAVRRIITTPKVNLLPSISSFYPIKKCHEHTTSSRNNNSSKHRIISTISSKSESISSNIPNSTHKEKGTPTFRPRRYVPMEISNIRLRHAPKPHFTNKIHKNETKASIKLGALPHSNFTSLLTSKDNSEGAKELSQIFGPETASTLRHLHHLQNIRGNVCDMPNVESLLKGIDYLTSQSGSAEDLAMERRATMDLLGFNLEEREMYLKELRKLFWNEEMKLMVDEDDDDITEDDVKGMSNDDEKEAIEEFNTNEEEQDLNQKAFGPWATILVRTDRVQKVLRGGRLVRFRSLIIGGNTNGCAGFGIGKSHNPGDATDKAIRMSKRNIFFVDRYQHSGITTDLMGKHNSCKVCLRSVKSNYGLRGHPLVLEILKLFGISNCGAKTHGNRNIYNVVYATFKALLTHESMEDIALKRGKRLMNLQRAKWLGLPY